MDCQLSEFLNSFNAIVKRPLEFLSVQEELSEKIKDLTKQVYDYGKTTEEFVDKKTLPQLIIKQFDEEQIWQELELQNESCTDDIVQALGHLVAKKDKLKFPLQLKCNVDDGEDMALEKIKEDEEDYLEEEEGDDIEDEDLDDEEDKMSNEDMIENGSFKDEVKAKQKKTKPSIVDDKFFKLADLELFLHNEDKKEEKSKKETDSMDLFHDIDVEEAADYKYSDFFDKPEGDFFDEKCTKSPETDSDINEEGDLKNAAKTSQDHVNKKKCENTVMLNTNDDKKKKNVRFTLLDSDGEDNSESDNQSKEPFSKKMEKSNQTKSSFEERQGRLGRVIEKLEEDALTEKPWQLKGEVTANARPQNSLLEEAVDFDFSVRPAPVISEEVTLKLEDIIIQRIKDKAWDDVERKVKPVDTPTEFRKKLTLDQEKSKLSLAEVYEQEFIKQREAATADDTERQEVEPALHVETRSMLHALFNKLDALSNYHFTPRPVAPELKVVTNVPALVMEEVAPVTVSDAALLAPQEIRGKKRRGELISKEERTATDKKRARRLKKTKQRQKEKEKAEKEKSKLHPGLGHKQRKLQIQKDLLNSSNISKMEESNEKVVKSSTAFFNKLQDEVTNHIQSKTKHFTKKKDKRNITAKKLKL